MSYYTIRVLDHDDCAHAEYEDVYGLAAAKRMAREMLSEALETHADTTQKVEVLNEYGDCVWDAFPPA